MVLGKLDSYVEKKKSEVRTFTHTIYKNKLIMDKDLKVRPESLKHLEDNISRTG